MGSKKFCFIGAAGDNIQNRARIQGLNQIGHKTNDLRTTYGLNRDFVQDFSNYPVLIYLPIFFALFLLENMLVVMNTALNPAKVKDSDILYAADTADFSFVSIWAISKFTNTPVIFSGHVSTYYAYIDNLAIFDENSIMASLTWHFDRWAMKKSDSYLTMSNTMIKKFEETYNLESHSLDVVYVTTDIESYNMAETSTNHDVIYWGFFLPHHGLEKIIDAAERTPDIEYELIGTGTEREKLIKECKSREIKNVHFPGYVNYSLLRCKIENSKICLGNFGNQKMVDLNITTKISEASAHGKAILTKDSSSKKEIFAHEESIYLCDNTPESIARGIKHLINDNEVRKSIEEGSRATFEKHLSPVAAAEKITSIADSLNK